MSLIARLKGKKKNGTREDVYFPSKADLVEGLTEKITEVAGSGGGGGKTSLAIPTLKQSSFTYSGNEIDITQYLNDYDANYMTIGGTTEATAAGEYTTTFDIKLPNTFQWGDNTVIQKSVTWKVDKQIVAIPTVTDTEKTYTGNVQSPTISTYDTDLINVSGDTGTDVGNYTVAFTLVDSNNYQFGSGNTSVPWSIAKKLITKPTASTTSSPYTGSQITLGDSNYDDTYMTRSGNTGTNAGDYTATYSLKDTANTAWTDNTTADVTIPWKITKIAGNVTVSNSSVTLSAASSTATVTVTRSGDGTITATSSNTSIATVSGTTTLTITGVGSGSTTITVNVAEGTNYLATSATISVTSTVPSSTLNDNTWAVISEVSQAGLGDTYWDVGDCKEITLNGKIGSQLTLTNEKLCVFILDFNHAMNGTAENNIIWGGFKTALTDGVDVALVDAVYGTDPTSGTIVFNMNHSWTTNSGNGYYGTNFGGWKGTDLRYDILGATSTAPSEYNQLKSTSNVGYDATAATLTSPKADTLLAALPSDLRSAIRLWTRWVDAVGNNSNVDANIKATVDAITLLAEPEIFASRSYANEYEKNHNTRMAYYENGNGTMKKKHNDTATAVNWWESSPYYLYTYYFCYVYTNGSANRSDAYHSYALAPAFKT